MKKIFILSCLFCLFGFSSNAQVTKAEIEQAIADVGVTIKDIKTIYIGNLYTFYSDGTSQRSYNKYEGSKYKFFEVTLTEHAVKFVYSKDGVTKSARMLPYAEMSNIAVSTVGFDIEMRN